jgi:uncharacterized membrane protein
MNKLMKHIDSKLISEAIEKFESEIDFEFIPVIAGKSSYVDHVKWMISLFLLLLFVGLIDYFFQDSYASKVPYFIAAPILAIILGALLDKSDWVDRFFISKPERQRQAFHMAERIFFKKKLHESKSHNALLLFISVLEREIVLLPDPRSNITNIQQISDQLLQTLQKAFKKNQYQQGLIDALDLLRSNLIEKHKKTSETPNQFSNTLIWWKD